VNTTQRFWVPFARSHNPVTHTDWEGTGVTPDISVPAADALSTAYRAALRKLVSAIQDPEEKSAVERLLANPSAK
jgi:C-terminal processing protease CtpA/Prc